MTVVIDGTNGISGVNGSASSPAFEGADADSGIFINSANEVNASLNSTPVWSAVSTFGFKNRLINGAMVIDQRNAGASGTATGYNLDRWAFSATQASKFTWQQNAGAVTPPAGFRNYLGFTSSSAYSVLTSDLFEIYQPIEGLNVYDLAWGTASAATVTLSFWVRSSLTGTFSGSIRNSAQNRSYPYTYTISAANTWEQKTVTIAGDTTGTWLTTNGIGLYVTFSLGAGSTYTGTANTWAAANYPSATGAVNVVGTNGATFYVTGVQLEEGSTATSFDYRDYGRELMMCQRYCIAQTGAQLLPARGTGTTSVQAGFTTPVAMRAAPSITASVAATAYSVGGAGAATATLSVAAFYQTGIQIGAAGLSGISDDRAAALSITGAFVLSAEL